VTVSTFLALLPALLGLSALQSDRGDLRVRHVVVEGQVIMRVPVRPRLAPPAFEWREKKGPKCIPIHQIRAASLSGPEQVDFLLRDRRRIRAELSEGCKALDFYAGFYLESGDERMCAERDFIHSRMGGRCEIDRLRLLVPRLKD
jgi:hypothetical protein